MAIKLLTSKDYKVSHWSGGQTTELFIYPETADYKALDFDFRISSATVENESSTFTILNKINRFISPIDGHLSLSHDHEKPINLKPFQCHEFSGNLSTKSQGIVTDFNLMCQEHCLAEMHSTDVTKAGISYDFKDSPSFVIIYNPMEAVTFKSDENCIIHKKDTLILKSPKHFELSAEEKTSLYICIIRL